MTPQEYLEFTRTTAARHTSGISDEDWATYVRLGLISEVGEVAGQVKRIIRDDGGVLTDERRGKLLDELGDVLWYWAQRCDTSGVSVGETVILSEWLDSLTPVWSVDWGAREVERLDGATGCDDWWVSVPAHVGHFVRALGSTLEEVAARNVEKLSARVTAGTIHGEGDER